MTFLDNKYIKYSKKYCEYFIITFLGQFTKTKLNVRLQK